MKTTITHASQFRDAFRQADRQDQFSYEALNMLYEYFEDIDPDMELDVVAICCEYYEDTPEAIANNYWDKDSVPEDEDELRDEVRKYLEANTALVGETSSGFVYAAFMKRGITCDSSPLPTLQPFCLTALFSEIKTMIDLSKLDPADAERIAYAEGFTGVAALYARLSDAEHLNSANEDEIEYLKDTLLQCLPFFEDWRETMGDDNIRSMDFMIRLIKQSLGESST